MKSYPRSNVAEEITNESSTSSNGSTTLNRKTGRKNHSTTSQKVAGKNFGNFIGETQIRRKTIASYEGTSDSRPSNGDSVPDSAVTPWLIPWPQEHQSEGHCPDTITSTKDTIGAPDRTTRKSTPEPHDNDTNRDQLLE